MYSLLDRQGHGLFSSLPFPSEIFSSESSSLKFLLGSYHFLAHRGGGGGGGAVETG